MVSVRDDVQSKLSPKFYGPYELVKRIGAAAYRLQLPARACVHNVFHVVFLKKYEGAPPLTVPPLPPIMHSWAVLQPEQVVQACPTVDSWSCW
jgi:hypothetical protein